MSESSIRKLKNRFIWVSMIALAATMLLIAGFLYIGTMVLNRQTIFSTLEYIVENDGELVRWEDGEITDETREQYLDIIDRLFNTEGEYKSQEFQYATRYFAVFVDDDEQIVEVKTGHIESIDETEAVEYTYQALGRSRDFGRIDQYYYLIGESNGNTIVVYLDGTSVLHTNQRILYLALILIGFGMVIAFFIVRVLSQKVIKNELKNAEMQKQFMTNISHELKTPLAVIRANAEMCELLYGSNEWNDSTVRQVDRMDALIKNLVQISKASENRMNNVMEELDVTKAITESVQNFESLATRNKTKIETRIEKDVKMYGDDAQLRQLCGLLMDNAIKYCDPEGEIVVELYRKSKSVHLVVSNDYAEGENVDYTQFFQRFYREDQSHNVDKGGFGIGLSIAEDIVDKFHGDINASWKNGKISFHCILKGLI